jgi:hypothetical protein
MGLTTGNPKTSSNSQKTTLHHKPEQKQQFYGSESFKSHNTTLSIMSYQLYVAYITGSQAHKQKQYQETDTA